MGPHLDATADSNPPVDRDEQLGEAIETYLELAEAGTAPDPEEFAARYPELHDDLKAALDGLSLVRGLVGEPAGPGRHLESGRKVAGYRIVGELGRGGMGVVYEAVHVGLDRPVALKVLGGHAAPDSTSRRRFLNEARTAAGLHHTHIVPVFDVGQLGSLCYYAMQRIEGCGLDRVLRHLRRDRATAAGSGSSIGSVSGLGRAANLWGKVSSHLGRPSARRTPLSSSGSESKGQSLPPLPALSHVDTAQGLLRAEEETATWFGQSRSARLLGPEPQRERDEGPPPFIPPRGGAYFRWVAGAGRMAAEALAFAHQRGIIHRDVKPSNLLVDGSGHVWMTDFGLARRLADPGLTHHEGILGTPRYMSPEQAGTGAVDGRSDVYSLGATLYELLTLRPPFDGRSAAELAEQIRDRDPVSPRRIDPRIPRDLETVVLKALHKRPADRYTSAAELADDLERFLCLEPVRARRISPAGQLWRFARRRPALSIVSTAAAVTVITVVTVAHFHMKRERDDAVTSRSAKEVALQQLKVALRQKDKALTAERAARARQYASEAKSVLSSIEIDRRAKGLSLLKEAAALGPDPSLRAQLRDRAIEFLVLRDVVAQSGFATEHARAIAFDGSGERLAVLSGDGEELGVWDVETREALDTQRLRPDAPASDPGDGSTTTTTTTTKSGGGNRRRGFGGGYSGTLAAAGAHLFVVVPGGRGFRMVDAATGAPLCDVPTEGRTVLTIAAARDGDRLVTIEAVPQMRPNVFSQGPALIPPSPYSEYRIRLWNGRPDPDDPDAPPRPIKELRTWKPSARTFASPLVAISPDGQTVAAARTSNTPAEATTIALWSGEDGQELRPVEAQTEVSALAIGPRGRLAAAGGGAVRIWDLDSRNAEPTLNTQRTFLDLLCFSPGGHMLAAAGRGADVELWDTDAHTLIAALPTTERIADIAFSPDGKSLAAAGRAGETAVWSVVEPEARVQLSKPDGFAPPLAFRADGLLAIGSAQNEVHFWRPGRSLRPCSNAAKAPTKPTSPVSGARFDVTNRPPLALGFDADGRLLALESSALRLWAEPGKSSVSSRVGYLGFSPGGPRGFYDATLARTADGRAFYFTRGRQVLAWRAGEPDQWHLVKAPATDPSNDLDEGMDTPALEDGGSSTDWLVWHALAVAPAGDRLFLVDNAGDTHAWALDPATGEALRREWVLPGGAWRIALSPDGHTLALGDRDGTVALVNANSGVVRAGLHPSGGEATGPGSPAVTFAPDSRELAVGSPQGQIQIWAVAQPNAPVLRLPGHRGTTTLAYDPNGRYLATGGGEALIDIWDMPRVRAALEELGLGW